MTERSTSSPPPASDDADFFERVYESSPDMLYSVDLESGDIVRCNPTCARKIGVDRDAIVGLSELELYHPESRGRVESARERLRDDQTVDNLEVELLPRDEDAPLDAFLSAASIEYREGTPVLSHSVLHDISELKQTERKLKQQTERLQRSNEELEQFAYLASHDLQEPLRMVASYTQLLAKRYEDQLDERAQKYIDYAVDGAQRMKALINDLLEYSRVGRRDETHVRISMEELLAEVEANLKMRIAESGGEVVYDELPDIEGKPTQIRQLFQNLVDNGLKFSEAETPRVEIRGETREDEAHLEIEDNGIGFDEDNADRIFQVFQRLHERGAYEGTGAGLAIVDKIVQHHDGTIEVDSEPGRGTLISLTLPAA